MKMEASFTLVISEWRVRVRTEGEKKGWWGRDLSRCQNKRPRVVFCYWYRLIDRYREMGFWGSNWGSLDWIESEITKGIVMSNYLSTDMILSFKPHHSHSQVSTHPHTHTYPKLFKHTTISFHLFPFLSLSHIKMIIIIGLLLMLLFFCFYKCC